MLKYFKNHDALIAFVSNDPRVKGWSQSDIETLWYFAHVMIEGAHSIRETKIINGFKFEIIKCEIGILELKYYPVN